MDVSDQVVVLWAVINGHFDDVPISDINKAEERLLVAFATNRKLKDHLEQKEELDDPSIRELEKLVTSVVGSKKVTTESTEKEQKAQKRTSVPKVVKKQSRKLKVRRIKKKTKH